MVSADNNFCVPCVCAFNLVLVELRVLLYNTQPWSFLSFIHRPVASDADGRDRVATMFVAICQLYPPD